MQHFNIVAVVLQTSSDFECERSAATTYLQTSLLSDAVVQKIGLPWGVDDEILVVKAVEVSAENTECATQLLSLTTFAYDVNV